MSWLMEQVTMGVTQVVGGSAAECDVCLLWLSAELQMAACPLLI